MPMSGCRAPAEPQESGPRRRARTDSCGGRQGSEPPEQGSHPRETCPRCPGGCNRRGRADRPGLPAPAGTPERRRRPSGTSSVRRPRDLQPALDFDGAQPVGTAARRTGAQADPPQRPGPASGRPRVHRHARPAAHRQRHQEDARGSVRMTWSTAASWRANATNSPGQRRSDGLSTPQPGLLSY